MCRTRIRRTTSRRTSRSASCGRWTIRQRARRRGTRRCRHARWPICRHGFMIGHLKRFLQFLALNRNASAHTVRAYETDLSQFLGYVAAAADLKKQELAPSHLDRAALRGFLGELHKQGLSRATAARKLAAVRTFLRYLR